MRCLPMVALLSAAVLRLSNPVQSEVIIEGSVKLPPIKPTSAAASRYQLKAGVAAAPEPPVAVVYLEGTFPGAGVNPSASTNVIQVTQRNYQFVPAILPVKRGTLVRFPNQDEDYHHVFSYSRTKEFDLGRYRNDETPAAVNFDKSGVVKIGCEIHGHMRAYVLVLDTPHFTTTDSSGNFRLVLKDVPAGKYNLKAWANERTAWEQPVELKEGAALRVNFPGP